MKLNQPLWGWQLILVSHLSFGHGNQVRNADKFCTIKRKYFDFSVSCSFVWLTKDRSMQGLVKGAILCFRNPYFYFWHGESTSTASQLTSPASQKSKDLNKVLLLLQDLACHLCKPLYDTKQFLGFPIFPPVLISDFILYFIFVVTVIEEQELLHSDEERYLFEK